MEEKDKGKRRKNILQKKGRYVFPLVEDYPEVKRLMGATGLGTVINQNLTRNNCFCISLISHTPCHAYSKIFVTESKTEVEKAWI